MFANVFEVLARELDHYFDRAPPRDLHAADGSEISGGLLASNPGEDNDPKVKIIGLLRQEDQQESIRFELNKVTPILINIEAENQLRPADRFARTAINGTREKIWPDVRLNLYILFVSHFYDYTDSLYYLGLVTQYFQTHPILDHSNTPELSPAIDRLLIELVTLPFAQQNEVWNALRTAYHPSLLYKVGMLVFQDQPDVTGAGEVKQVFSDTEDLYS